MCVAWHCMAWYARWHGMLWHAVWCGMVCYVAWHVAFCGMPHGMVCCVAWHGVYMLCGMAWYAMWHDMWHFVWYAAWHGTLCGMVWYAMWHAMVGFAVWYAMWHGMVLYGMWNVLVWYIMWYSIWCGMVYDMASYIYHGMPCIYVCMHALCVNSAETTGGNYWQAKPRFKYQMKCIDKNPWTFRWHYSYTLQAIMVRMHYIYIICNMFISIVLTVSGVSGDTLKQYIRCY